MSAVATAGSLQTEHLEQYRRELVGYCYRMLGSIHEAEDAVQDTMLRAWRATATFEDQAGPRPWLYRIATNVCIDMVKGRSRRFMPIDVTTVGNSGSLFGDRRPAATWVQPAPDSAILPLPTDPADRAVSRESVRLAFIAALQHLAPRQRAVLILRDVLRWQAAEVAVLLGTSADAVNSTLRRARATVGKIDHKTAPSQPSTDDQALLAAYIAAFEHHDVDALVTLLHDDAILEMPPFDLWLRGKDDIRQWLIAVDALADHKLTPLRANGCAAAAVYGLPQPGGPPTAHAIHVLDIVAGNISAIHAFIDPSLFELFGAPIVHQA